jgi:membrane-associated protease RseP (regulator of RpoE activity)
MQRWRDVSARSETGSVDFTMTLTEQERPAAPTPPSPPSAREEGPDENGGVRRVLQLLLAVGLITAFFVLAGWGDLLLFIAILVAIVMLHELGHFATAKWAGMKVTEYFVGFGPRLWSVRRGETEYGVKAIPAGGYVRITGFTSTEEVAAEDEPRAYRNQPFYQRIVVASAGSAMHFLIAFVLALILVIGYGTASNNYTVSALEHWKGVATTPAAAAGLRPGDTIVSVDGKAFSGPNSMSDAIRGAVGRPLVLGVERGGRLLRLTATPESGKGITVDGQKLADRGYLGVQIEPANRSVGLAGAVPASFATLWHVADLNLAGLGQTFSPHGVASVLHEDTNTKAATAAADNPGSAPRPVSIIGIAGLGVDAQHQGFESVLALLIAINIIFGILNMLPMIPLDGGHVAIAAYEWIRTKRGEAYYRADITKLFPVAFMFLAFLGIFVLSGVFLDITHPIQYP